ncbi:MAG: VPS10 domain-containing protein [Planctomycetota bacterium]
MRSRLALSLLLASPLPPSLVAQEPPGPVPSVLFDTLDWRLVGPFRGGRCAAVCGIVGDRDTYYMGTAGGGVWKTSNAGKQWRNVSDGYFGGSIGAVAVAPSNADVIYVGGGEKTVRGNVSSGDGVWKSVDAGKTWEFAGLSDSRHIGRIRVHPKDPDVAYVAVMGHISGPNEARGVYRTRDGGRSWKRVLFVNQHAGAVDLCLAPNDPDTIYATTWRILRTPYSLESGGDGSGLWKSTDGGDTWDSLHDREGMPEGPLGISGIAPSPADPSRVCAQIESKEGGLFRSDDAGETWRRINDDRSLRQRAWYCTRVFADPKDVDTVYVLNVAMHKSTDGGASFERVRTPHSDNHDLWIDPRDPKRMIESNDGGANVSSDGGRTWSTQGNQPTAQFYRITVDDDRPYRIYGAQQDNSTVRIRHRAPGAGIGEDHWESTAGGESGWIAPKPGDPEIVFGGSYGGYLTRRDHRRGLSRTVTVWPDNPMGAGVEAMRYRFQWNFPILWSRHYDGVLYTGAQVLFASSDEGKSWQPISPDLTRNDASRMGSSGGPITKDNTGVEYYCTIFTVDEGRKPGTIWVGSDDGLVHVTRDSGRTWSNVTPPDMPEWMQINCIAADPHRDGGAYFAGTRYKLDDFRPYLYRTEDYGKTWRRIDGGLDPGWFTRCIRPDPVVDGMLYCGTERSVWMSYNHGRRWQRLANELPLVPVTDLVVAGNELIAATQGRAFWSFDHLPHLRQLNPGLGTKDLHVFTPVPVAQWPSRGRGRGAGRSGPTGMGQNPDSSLHVRFYIGGDEQQPVTEEVEVVVKDFDGKVVYEGEYEPEGAGAREDDGDAEDDADEAEVEEADGDEDDGDEGEGDGDEGDGGTEHAIDVHRGMNDLEITWRSEGAKILDGMILWSGRGGAARPAPGDYTITVTYGTHTQTVVGRIEPDPRTDATIAELQDRYRLVRDGNALVTEAHEAIEQIRSLREQMDQVVERMDEGQNRDKLQKLADEAKAAFTSIEEALYQTRSKSRQDPLNYPIRLTDKLLGVLGATNRSEFGPTNGQRDVAAQLSAAIRVQLERFAEAKGAHVAKFNAAARDLAAPHIR